MIGLLIGVLTWAAIRRWDRRLTGAIALTVAGSFYGRGDYGIAAMYAALGWLWWNMLLLLPPAQWLVDEWRRTRRLTIDWQGFGRTRGAFTIEGHVARWPWRPLAPYYDELGGDLLIASGGPSITVGWSPWAEYWPPAPPLEFPTFSAPRGGIEFLPSLFADVVAPPRHPRLDAIRALLTGRRR